jgi:hypothetical protein
MVREISASVRAEVLWDAGHRTPKSLMRRGNIPLRTAERYISKLRKGESLERKQYTRRAKPSKTPQLVWIWQQDGSSVHRADESFYYTYENMPQKLKFPFYSPDLSPIENVWGWLKGEVNKDMPTSVETLKRCIRKHWNRITPAFLKPYFDSMPSRMEMVLENEGGKIDY